MSPTLPHNPPPRPKWPFWPHDPMLMLLGTDWRVNTMFNLFATPSQWLRPRIMENWWLGQDVLKFPCISDSVFCIIWCWGNFEQKLTSLTQKSRRLQDFYFRVNFHSRLGANISPLHSLRSFENITNQANGHEANANLFVPQHQKKKKSFLQFGSRYQRSLEHSHVQNLGSQHRRKTESTDGPGIGLSCLS